MVPGDIDAMDMKFLNWNCRFESYYCHVFSMSVCILSIQHEFEDNQKIEPVYYLPIIPMLLVNGAEGIGTGWSTKIPNYNPRDIVHNLR